MYNQGFSLLDISQKIGITTPILAQWADEVKRERRRVAAANDPSIPVINSIENITVQSDIFKVIKWLLPVIIFWIILLKLIHF